MKLTKLDMARVIVMALYNKKELPPVDSWEVRKMVRNRDVASLSYLHTMALASIESRKESK